MFLYSRSLTKTNLRCVRRGRIEIRCRNSYRIRKALCIFKQLHEDLQVELQFLHGSSTWKISFVSCRDFFATYSPYGDLIDALTNPPPLCQNDASLVRSKAPDIEQYIDLELPEIYHGAIKKMKITREEFIDEAQVRTKIVEETLTVSIPAGTPTGTKIRFEGAGNCSPKTFPSDIVFEVRERTHERYRREGADLQVEVPISLKDAIVGFPLELIGVDGRRLAIQIVDVVRPGYVKSLKGEGLPVADGDEPLKRGDLHLTFSSKYLKSSEWFRHSIKHVSNSASLFG